MSDSKKNLGSASLKTRNICFCALFAAIICVCTLISIPLPIGYFNLGDAAVILSGWLLGPLFGCIAAAIGSALADILVGYVIYAPATAIIKAVVALCACGLFAVFKRPIKSEKLEIIPRVLAAIVGEAFMVGGYLFYESIVLSYGVGAFASVPGNCLQGVCGVVISVVIYAFLPKKIRGTRV